MDDNFQKTTSGNLLPVTHKRKEPGETPRCVLILVPVPGRQMLISVTSSLNRKANVHTTDCESYLELSFHPWCSHLLQYGVLSGRKEFIPCPTHHLILGPIFFKDTSILIQNRKISISPKNEDGALEKCFCHAPPFETLTALQCQPCDCLLLQYLSHFYQTTK